MALPNVPRGRPERPVSPCNTACFAMPNGSLPQPPVCQPLAPRATAPVPRGANCYKNQAARRAINGRSGAQPHAPAGARHAEPSGDNGGKAAPGGRPQAKTKV